jgi:hypothetical protein
LWAKHCYSLNRRSGQTIDLPPGEMFAEMYEACAMGMTHEQVDDAGFNSTAGNRLMALSPRSVA